MANSPIPLILIFLFMKNRNNINIRPPVINTLELESFLDNCRTVLNTVDKINGFTSGIGQTSLPDMKKIMEIVEKLPL